MCKILCRFSNHKFEAFQAVKLVQQTAATLNSLLFFKHHVVEKKKNGMRTAHAGHKRLEKRAGHRGIAVTLSIFSLVFLLSQTILFCAAYYSARQSVLPSLMVFNIIGPGIVNHMVKLNRSEHYNHSSVEKCPNKVWKKTKVTFANVGIQCLYQDIHSNVLSTFCYVLG